MSGRILVLGADGFLGSHLTDALLASGHRVRAFDRFVDGRARHLQQHDGLELCPGDFLDARSVGDAVEDVEVVFHLVSLTTPATSAEDPYRDIDTNVRASIRLFELCVERGVQRCIFPSSGGAIYGHGSEVAIPEDSSTLPVSPYAIGKLAIEGYLRFFRATHGLDSLVLRISNPYGPRQDLGGAQGVIPIFLDRIGRREPITVFGDGTTVRDYIHIDDVVARMVAMHDRSTRHDTYNIGSGQGASVNQVIGLIEQVTGVQARVDAQPIRSTDVDRIVLDVSRAQTEFGFAAPMGLADGIARTWGAMATHAPSVPARDDRARPST